MSEWRLVKCPMDFKYVDLIHTCETGQTVAICPEDGTKSKYACWRCSKPPPEDLLTQWLLINF